MKPNGTRFSAEVTRDGKKTFIGNFATPLEAAVAYARHVAAATEEAAEPEAAAAAATPPKRKRTENPPTPQTAPAQAEVPADPAAPAAPAPAAAAPAAPAESPLEVQLAKLKKMKTKELIDEATYAQMCKAALDADHAAFLKTLGA